MKKFTKIALSIAAFLFAFGLILVVVGGLSGGFRKTMQWVSNGELSFGNVNFGAFFHYHDVDINEKYDVYSGSGSHEGIASLEEFENLNLMVGGGEVRVEYRDVESVNIDYDNVGDIQFYVENNTLVISQAQDLWNGFEGADITLTLPYETSFDTVRLSLGAGTAEMDGIEADKVEFEVGAGKVEIESMKVTTATLEIGAGQIVVNNGMITDLEVEVGMGSFEYEGSIVRDLNAECAMGEMTYDLEGSIKDHNYDVECSMGNITVGNKSYSGIASEKKIDNNSNSDFNLECSMGNISVSFEN